MKEQTSEKYKTLIETLKSRFYKNINRHIGIEWADLLAKLEASPDKLDSLSEMERTGGEPDVVGYDGVSGEYIFYDCSAESPIGRRSLCYDRDAMDSRKENKPANNVIDMTRSMGITLLSEKQYQHLQETGNYDTKTSSWIETPPEIRQLGGALFAEFRYNHLFIFYNSAPSYYAARGFRGCLKV